MLICESLEQTKSLLKVSDECWVLIVFLEKITSIACLEGSGLKYIFHWSAQSAINLRSLFNIFDERKVFLIFENIDVSSANILILERRPSGRSLIKTRNNKGPKIDP